MTAVSNFRNTGSFSATKARTPTFWRPTALSIPEAVGKSRGAGAPSMGSRERPLVTKPQRMLIGRGGRRLLLVINGEAFRREQVYLMTKSPGSVTLLKVEERTKDL